MAVNGHSSHFFIDNLNALSDIWDLEAVTLDVGGNGKVQKVSLKGNDLQRKYAKWHLYNLYALNVLQSDFDNNINTPT